MSYITAERQPLLEDADTAMRAGEFPVAEALLTRIVTQQTRDFPVWLRLAIARRQCGDYTGAMDALSAALALRPDDLPALLMKGSLLAAFGRREASARTYAAALAVAPDASTLPPQMRAELDRGAAMVAEEQGRITRLQNIRFDTGEPVSTMRLETMRDAMIAGSEGPLLFEGLPEVGFYDPDEFPGVTEMAAATPQILAEFQTLIANRAPELITAHGQNGTLHAESDVPQARKWSAIHLISDGDKDQDNAQFAPQTVEMYEALQPPRIAGRSPNLMFSILDPFTSIPPHHGVVNTRLVLHIPLIIPENCALRVGKETRQWKPGKALIFDDTIEHEAWNQSDELRVVLLGDLWRPELSGAECAAVARLMALK